jgi:phospholipase/carboxylesterase
MSNWIQTGLPLSESKKAIILLHGRGATAESILSLADYLELADFSIFAPQAAQRTWYPYGFMASDEGNLSSLNSSLQQVSLLFQFLIENGKAPEQIYVMGFSQGACLSLEFAARNAQKLGGVVAFTGGLIGEKLEEKNIAEILREHLFSSAVVRMTCMCLPNEFMILPSFFRKWVRRFALLFLKTSSTPSVLKN